MIPFHHSIPITQRGMHTMKRKEELRAGTALALARMKRRFPALVVHILTCDQSLTGARK